MLCALLLLGCADGARPAPGRRVLVLGLDGLDHALVQQMMARGDLPQMQRLARQGGFAPLQTTTPPQSPTAWSSFITGAHPGHHGIFDFIQRDPATLTPYLSTSRVEQGRALTIGALRIPLGGGEATLLRQGRPFWSQMDRHGVRATLIRVPAHFPPRDDGRAQVLTDMGTPDLLGTYGTFTLLTSDWELARRPLSGGRAVRLERRGDRYHAVIEGPPHPFSACQAPLTCPVQVEVDPDGKGALIQVGNHRLILAPGEWSEFVPVEFPLLASLDQLRGIVRLYLKSLPPTGEVTIYVSPLNIDPVDPALPISSPPGFAAELAQRVGRFYTQGMPEDTKALASGVLSANEFLQQAQLVLDQRRRMLTDALARFDGGLLFFYFGSSDQVAHMFFNGPRREALEQVYRQLDREVGRAVRRLSPGDLLLVISDHGFGPADTLFDLNRWLAQQRYLVARDPPLSDQTLGQIDWQQTQAYGLGLNGLYVNLRGREQQGQVPPTRREDLLARIERGLLEVRHPETGAQVVTQVSRPDRLYPGPALDRAPDLIVGYGRGFKVSDLSATGAMGTELFVDNRGAWSADHCGDPRLVPGVLLSNHRLRAGPYQLVDLAPTVLRHLGLPATGFVGRSVLETAHEAGKPPLESGPSAQGK